MKPNRIRSSVRLRMAPELFIGLFYFQKQIPKYYSISRTTRHVSVKIVSDNPDDLTYLLGDGWFERIYYTKDNNITRVCNHIQIIFYSEDQVHIDNVLSYIYINISWMR